MSTPYRLTHSVGILALCLLAFALVGCAPTQVRQKAGHHEAQESVSVLLMPVDIELSTLTTGGIKEVRAE